jgi:hypothetical protein
VAARKLFERLLALRNDVGLLAEEYDASGKRQLGNFPQAISHLALVNTAHNLASVHGPAHQRAAGSSATASHGVGRRLAESGVRSRTRTPKPPAAAADTARKSLRKKHG